MDLLATILTCSLYLQDDDLVRAIAEATPEGNPDFVLDAALDLTQVDPAPPPKNAADARARAEEMMARGDRPLLGLLEIPAAWLTAFGRDVGDAFSPCANVAIGSAMLSAFDAACARARPPETTRPPVARRSGRPDPARRRCVLGHYEEAIGSPDFARTVELELRAQRPRESSVDQAPIFPPAAAPGWGPNQLLVPIRTSIFQTP